MTADAPRLDARAIAVLGPLFGLITGWLEVAGRLAIRLISGADPMVSVHFVWMVPLAMAALFLLATLPLLLLAAWRPLPALPVLSLFCILAVLGPFLSVGWLARWAQLILALGVGGQLARLLTPRDTALVRRGRPAAVVLASLVILVGAGMLGGRAALERRAVAALPATANGAPNVLLIILDTVRAASMSLYGHDRPTTPNLERFAERGVVFARAWSTAPWTLPSHGSLFTGRYASELSTDLVTPLDDAYPTLAEHFRGRGYHTAGFTANIRYANHAMGMARGFLHYEDYPVNAPMVVHSALLTRRIAMALMRAAKVDEKLVRKSARAITDRFLGWQAAHDARPFLVFLNYFDAHAPYLPPDSLADRFGPRRSRRAMHDLSVVEHWSEEDLVAERAAYEASLLSIDQQLARLFDTLARRGVLDHTIVVLTSDHGEQFGEHGLTDHGNSLYLPVLDVPLLVRYPARVPAGTRIETPVSLRDVPATLVDLADAGPAPFPGTSLAALWSDAGATPSPLYAEVREGIRPSRWLPLARGPMSAVIHGDYHYIVNGDGVEELYSLSRDPHERVNLADSVSAQDVLQGARTVLAGLRASSARHAMR